MERSNIYGITISGKADIAVLSEYGSIQELLKAIKENEFIYFETASDWFYETETYNLNNVVIKCSDITAIYW